MDRTELDKQVEEWLRLECVPFLLRQLPHFEADDWVPPVSLTQPGKLYDLSTLSTRLRLILPLQDPTTRAEIESLVSSLPSSLSALTARLSSRIAFGTAGLRAPVQAGWSSMNSLVVLQATQGLAAYAESVDEGAKSRGVVVGRDHRNGSEEFARLTAGVFRRRGWKVYELDGLVHTPTVVRFLRRLFISLSVSLCGADHAFAQPFATKRYNAFLGVMITASHNPAKDNGYKVLSFRSPPLTFAAHPLFILRSTGPTLSRSSPLTTAELPLQF